MAEESRSKRELDECDSEIKKYQDYAVKAVNAGNEDDAKNSLGKAEVYIKERVNCKIIRACAYKCKQICVLCMISRLMISENLRAVRIWLSKLAVAKTQEKSIQCNLQFHQQIIQLVPLTNMRKMADNAFDKANAMAELNSSSEKENGSSSSARSLGSNY